MKFLLSIVRMRFLLSVVGTLLVISGVVACYATLLEMFKGAARGPDATDYLGGFLGGIFSIAVGVWLIRLKPPGEEEETSSGQ